MLAGLLPLVASAQTNDPTELYRDSRTHKPYVIFAARDGLPGHAFTILGEELDNGLLWNMAVFGFYPDGGVIKQVSSIVSAPGKVDYRWDDLLEPREVEFRVNVTAPQSEKIRGLLATWGTKKYSLLGNNCNKLASEIARLIGLNLPAAAPETTLPAKYISALKAAN